MLLTDSLFAKAKDIFENRVQQALELLKRTQVLPGDKFILTSTINFTDSDDSDEPLIVSPGGDE